MENGMKINFVNRDNEVITFEGLPDGTFTMRGGHYYRYGIFSKLHSIDDNVLNFVDPSGGPYIAQGMSMGFINPNWLGYIVWYCRFKDDYIVIHTYPDRVVKNHSDGKIIWKIYNPNGVSIEEFKSYEEAIKYIEEKYNHNEFGQVDKIGD